VSRLLGAGRWRYGLPSRSSRALFRGVTGIPRQIEIIQKPQDLLRQDSISPVEYSPGRAGSCLPSLSRLHDEWFVRVETQGWVDGTVACSSNSSWMFIV
jgi:hypothetical protein